MIRSKLRLKRKAGPEKVYEEFWKLLNPGNKPAISKTEVQERIRKIRRAPTEGQNSSPAIKQDFFDESESRGIVEALMPSGCFSKMTFEDLKAFGARSTFIDDLAVFRFRAFITEKSRTQKGQVSFDKVIYLMTRRRIC